MTTNTSIKTRVPRIISRSEHNISRENISKAALKVLYRLHEAGYDAYLVGGSVRDLLLGLIPKDFDVATNAHPEQIRSLFSNSHIIGRRFKLVHIRYGREIIEVATYRGHDPEHEHHQQSASGMILRDNVYGSLEEDAMRRDFTVNALYYNIADFSVVDDVDGMKDILSKTLRMIGDPKKRFREDPVRMIRAVRLAAKLGLTIEKKTIEGIHELKELLVQVPSARLFDEFLKISLGGHSEKTFSLLENVGLFSVLFPRLWRHYQSDDALNIRTLITNASSSTDARIAEEKGVHPAFLIAVLLWPSFKETMDHHLEHGEKFYVALARSLKYILKHHEMPMSVPRRLTLVIEEIWTLQYHLTQTRRSRIFSTFNHPRFRAAYDFMLLRAEIDLSLKQLCVWWEKFQVATKQEQEELIKNAK